MGAESQVIFGKKFRDEKRNVGRYFLVMQQPVVL
jgi:hypothetical protein